MRAKSRAVIPKFHHMFQQLNIAGIPNMWIFIYKLFMCTTALIRYTNFKKIKITKESDQNTCKWKF